METLGFDTKAVHGDVIKEDVHHAIRYPIYAGAAFSFDSAEDLEDAFAYRKPTHSYSRVTNPTVEAFERKINFIEDGRGTIAVASGMAAISNVLINLVNHGENIVSTSCLFGNTYSLLKHTLHSSTKLISGGATSIGGVIVDLGNCEWASCTSLEKYKRLRGWAFLSRLRKEVYRDLGACMSPHTAYLHSLGLETLSLRMDRICENALKIAEFLKENSKVGKINYPGMPDSTYFELAKKQFNNRFGGVLSFELSDKQTCFGFMNHLNLIKRASNLEDNTSLIIHPASTIFREFTQEEKDAMSLGERLIRLSIGLENIIIEDYDFIVDGTDNFPAKFLINDACVLANKPFSHAGILQFSGQAMTYVPGNFACCRCIFHEPPPPNTVPISTRVKNTFPLIQRSNFRC